MVYIFVVWRALHLRVDAAVVAGMGILVFPRAHFFRYDLLLGGIMFVWGSGVTSAFAAVD